jgi:6-pyruvoyltetrahydropterin/6-carboxytetrahydropterin synthase
MTVTVNRYHDFSCAHRSPGDDKCARIHGHNYRVTFHVTGPSIDERGRLVDFDIIKSRLCEWIEDAWDHRLLLWKTDPIFESIDELNGMANFDNDRLEPLAYLLRDSIAWTSFDTSTENMALFLINELGPTMFHGAAYWLSKVEISETRKCGVTVTADRATPFNPHKK